MTSQESRPSDTTHEYKTDSGLECFYILNDWLQDAHLSSEAIYRIVQEGTKNQEIKFSPEAWPTQKTSVFSMKPKQLVERLNILQQNYWNNQFVFLETIWEGYLENLIRELAKKLPSVLNELCNKYPSPNVMSTVLTSSSNIEELQEQVAEWFASQITRLPWSEQWKQLEKLNIGLPTKCQKERWWIKLDIYFEMRNCIIHRQCRASTSLRDKDSKIMDPIRLTPSELEFFRIQFLNAVSTIDHALIGRLRSPTTNHKGNKQHDRTDQN